MDEIRNARKDASDRVFRQDVLHFLERIAIALEAGGANLHREPYEDALPPLDTDQTPRYNVDANVCICGNDPKKACSACTPARMAWVYNMNPGWRPE
jgi:hypothetical protein